MRLLIDAQLPSLLADVLRRRGHEAMHVADLDLTAADDATLWEQAEARGFDILSKDEDFATRRLAATAPFPRVVWLRVGNCSNAAVLDWLVPLLPIIAARLDAGDTLIEVV